MGGGTNWVGPALKLGAAGYAAYTSMRGNRSRTTVIDGGHESVNATTFSKRRYKIGRRKVRNNRRLFNSIIGRGGVEIWRWQQTSPSILGPGRLPLGWMITGDGAAEYMPFHYMSITQLPTGIVGDGCRDDGMKRLVYNPVAQEYAHTVIHSQLNNGTTGFDGEWRAEQSLGSGAQSMYNTNKYYHAWTDIKFNLYGTRTAPITYTIMVWQCKQNVDPQAHFPYRDDVNLMFKDMMRPLLGNTLANNGKSEWQSDVRIVKKIVRTIQPLSYSDQAASVPNEYANTGHVQEVRLFMRHDRFRDYNWQTDPAQQAGIDIDQTSIGWDVYNSKPNLIDCEWGSKLYLSIMCTAARRENYNVNWEDYVNNQASWAIIQGSYDVCVRNKFVTT